METRACAVCKRVLDIYSISCITISNIHIERAIFQRWGIRITRNTNLQPIFPQNPSIYICTTCAPCNDCTDSLPFISPPPTSTVAPRQRRQTICAGPHCNGRVCCDRHALCGYYTSYDYVCCSVCTPLWRQCNGCDGVNCPLSWLDPTKPSDIACLIRSVDPTTNTYVWACSQCKPCDTCKRLISTNSQYTCYICTSPDAPFSSICRRIFCYNCSNVAGMAPSQSVCPAAVDAFVLGLRRLERLRAPDFPLLDPALVDETLEAIGPLPAHAKRERLQ